MQKRADSGIIFDGLLCSFDKKLTIARIELMITGTIKNKVDKIWTDIWAGGLTNPLTVIEQLTYLLFIRSLDEKELDNERMDALMGTKGKRIFPSSPIGQSMRWSQFKDKDAQTMRSSRTLTALS